MGVSWFKISSQLPFAGAFPSGSVVKNPAAKQETRVLSLDWEDPLEKEMATHSSVLAWEIQWTGQVIVHEVTKSWAGLMTKQ